MISVETTAHIGSDGMLKVEVPTPLSDTDVEVLLVIEPMPARALSASDAPASEESGRPQDD